MKYSDGFLVENGMKSTEENLEKCLAEIATYLAQNKETVTCAESCTAGGIAYSLTRLSGSSNWFERSFVTYSNESKIELVGVSPKSLIAFGAVSEVVVKEMALGALKTAKANYALAVSGIAGPSGGTLEKPVGTVCFAWASQKRVVVKTKLFLGDRDKVREQSIEHSLQGLVKFLNQ